VLALKIYTGIDAWPTTEDRYLISKERRSYKPLEFIYLCNDKSL
jgi:hypothetical protein